MQKPKRLSDIALAGRISPNQQSKRPKRKFGLLKVFEVRQR
jgi:hypothetical protein